MHFAWLSVFVMMMLAFGAAANNCNGVVVTATATTTVTITTTFPVEGCSSVIATIIESSTVIVTSPPVPSSIPSSALLLPQPSPVISEPSYNPDHISLLCPGAAEAAKASQAAGMLAAPMPFGSDRQANIASYDPLPTLAADLCEAPEHFHKVASLPGHGSIKNSCNYDVYVDSVGCGAGTKHELIAAGATWSEVLRSCAKESVVYKVTKADIPSKPVQFEVATGDGLLYYDISFLDCMKPNSTDLSGCPGWEGGVQCVPGRMGCPVFVCGPGEYCDGSTYTVPEFGIIVDGPFRNEPERIEAGAPVKSCSSAEGIAFEICAAD